MAKLAAEVREIGGQSFTVCFLDPDYRPNTYGKQHVCAMCSREIKNLANAKSIHLVDGGMWALLIADEDRYSALSAVQPRGQFAGEMGAHEIGSDCARKLPPGFAYSITNENAA